MKPLLLTVCAMLLAGMTLGQNIIDKHFSAYKAQENFTTIHVSSKAFELSAYLEFEDASEELEEFRQFLTTVKSFDMIAGKNIDNAARKYSSALKKVQATHEELMYKKEENGEFTFLIDETNGVVHELVMVGSSENDLAIFSLTGNMDLEQLSKMSKMMNSKEDTQLKKMYESGLHDIKAYPNPLRAGETLTIEVPAEMTNGTATLINLNGVRVKEVNLNGSYQKMTTDGLASGTYILEFQAENVRIRKKVLIR
ncbi:MAG: DUF4252 domain-containing protein [Bacteroidia bacterium]